MRLIWEAFLVTAWDGHITNCHKHHMLKDVRGSEHKTIGWASNEYVIGFYETTDYNHHISYLFQYLIAWQKVLEGQKQGDVVGTVPAKFKFPLTFHFFRRKRCPSLLSTGSYRYTYNYTNNGLLSSFLGSYPCSFQSHNLYLMQPTPGDGTGNEAVH